VKPTKKQQDEGERLLAFFESADDGYYESGKRRFEVNVKRHFDSYDLECAIETKLGESNVKKEFLPEIEKRLRKLFADSYIGDLIDRWIEFEADELYQNFRAKGCHQFDRGSEEQEHFKHCEVWGFAGRSGGHFLFDMNASIDDLTDIAEGYENRFSSKEEIAGVLSIHQQMEKDALWLKGYVDDYNKGLRCQDELEFRVEEAITDVMAGIQADIDHEKKVQRAKKIVDECVFVDKDAELLLSFIK